MHPQAESVPPRQSNSPIFWGNWGDLNDGRAWRGYLGSFSVFFWGRRLKKFQLFRGRKVHHRQNPDYAYAVNSVSRLKFARLWKACTQHRQMMRFSSAPLAQYCIPVNKVKLWNQQQHLFCRFTCLAIKETNFVLNCNSSFSVIFQSRRRHWKYDSSRYEYDWRRRLSHINMTDSDLTKYDWRRRLGGGGSGVYIPLPSVTLVTNYTVCDTQYMCVCVWTTCPSVNCTHHYDLVQFFRFLH